MGIVPKVLSDLTCKTKRTTFQSTRVRYEKEFPQQNTALDNKHILI